MLAAELSNLVIEDTAVLPETTGDSTRTLVEAAIGDIAREADTTGVLGEVQNTSNELAGARDTESHEQCSICLEIVDEAQAAMHCLGTAGRRHHFHGACLAPWVAQCQAGSREPSCPNCRGPVEVHRHRLASQLSQEVSVVDFLAHHGPIAEEDEEDGGWVRVRQRPTSIIDSLRDQFQDLDATLSTATRRPVPEQPGHWLQTFRASQSQPDSSQLVERNGIAPEPLLTSLTMLPQMEASESTSRSNPVADLAPDAETDSIQDAEDAEDVVGGLTEIDEANLVMPSELPRAASWQSRRPCTIDQRCVNTEHVVENVRVRFPFDEIMPPQKQIIENTVQAIIRGKHMLIESPTGTGKTMALICAALAAQRQICLWSGSAPRIIYCTRTHRQVKQVVSQVRKSPYRPWLQIVGSREQGLCIEPDMLQQVRNEGVTSSQACRSFRVKAEQIARRGTEGRYHGIDRTSCRFWMPLAESDTIMQAHRRIRSSGRDTNDGHGLLDIEELGALGRELHACPYFLSKAAVPGAELVVCPYNYVLEPSIAEAMGLLDDESIVIIDEGHNIEKHCREAGSAFINEKMFNEIHRRIDEASQYLLNSGNSSDNQRINSEIIESLQTTINNIHKVCVDTLAAFTSRAGRDTLAQDRVCCCTWFSTLERAPDSPTSVLGFIREIGVQSTFAASIKTLKDALQQRDTSGGRADGLAIQVIQALGELENVAKALEMCRNKPSHYKVHIEAIRTRGLSASQIPSQMHGRSDRTYEVGISLVHPEVIFENLANAAHSLIIASGTLAPTRLCQAELGTAFVGRVLRCPVEAPHVISRSQLGVCFVGTSRAGKELKCIQKNMIDTSFLNDLGETLLQVIPTIPGGVLVFFPSKSSLDKAIQVWRESSRGTSIWEALARRKGYLGIEGDLRGDEDLTRYSQAVVEHGTAVLFCVYRGRSSEGMSLSDNAVRGVVCVGIPLPPLQPAVILKKDYNDALAARASAADVAISGEDWYNLDAHRAINQALGRVIRHRHDYGAIVLIDARWTATGSIRAIKYLPLWLRELIFGQRANSMFGDNLVRTVDQVVAGLLNLFHLQRENLQATNPADRQPDQNNDNISPNAPESMRDPVRRVRARVEIE